MVVRLECALGGVPHRRRHDSGGVSMGTLFDARDRREMLARLSRLNPEARPIWGSFTRCQMICHVASAIRQGLGEVDLGPPRGPLSHWPLNWLLIHVIPFPSILTIICGN